MRSGANPYNNEAGLIDEFIGTAYEKVKRLSDNLDIVEAVHEELPAIKELYEGPEGAIARAEEARDRAETAANATAQDVITTGNALTASEEARDNSEIFARNSEESSIQSKAARDTSVAAMNSANQSKDSAIASRDAAGLSAEDSRLYAEASNIARIKAEDAQHAAEAIENSIFEWKGPWETGVVYNLSDFVRHSGSVYICVVVHSSSDFASDLAAGYWDILIQQGSAGAGTGDMLASVYDPNSKMLDAFSMGNMTETATHKIFKDTERTKLDGLVKTTSPIDIVEGHIMKTGDAGILGNLTTVTGSVDNYPIGSDVTSGQITETESVIRGFPALGSDGSTNRWWNVSTKGLAGSSARISQQITEIFGINTSKGRTFRRVKHGTTWSAWSEVALTSNLMPLGTITPWTLPRSYIPDGNVALDGHLSNRVDFPDLWAMLNAMGASVISDADWIANPSKRGNFSTGNGTTTFRFPDLNGKQAGSLRGLFLRGDGHPDHPVGYVHGDAIRNITGEYGITTGYGPVIAATGIVSGAFEKGAATTGSANGSTPAGNNLKFNAAAVVPTADENRPVAASVVWIMRARGGVSVVPAPGSAATLGSNTFTGNQKIIGDFDVTGTFTAKGPGADPNKSPLGNGTWGWSAEAVANGAEPAPKLALAALPRLEPGDVPKLGLASGRTISQPGFQTLLRVSIIQSGSIRFQTEMAREAAGGTVYVHVQVSRIRAGVTTMVATNTTPSSTFVPWSADIPVLPGDTLLAEGRAAQTGTGYGLRVRNYYFSTDGGDLYLAPETAYEYKGFWS